MIKEVEAAIDQVKRLADSNPELSLRLAEELLEALNDLIDSYQLEN